MRKQQGITLIGFIFMAALVAGAGVLAFRAVPIYTEYFTLKKILRNIDLQNNEATPAQIRSQFDRMSAADYQYDVKSSEVEITKEQGRIVLNLTYSRTIPVAGNVSLLFDFSVNNRK